MFRMWAGGAAAFAGSLGAARPAQPIVAIAHTPSGKGNWLAGSDGGMLAFGDAPFKGSTGGAFAFEAAGFAGSMGGTRLNFPITACSAPRPLA